MTLWLIRDPTLSLSPHQKRKGGDGGKWLLLNSTAEAIKASRKQK